MWALGVWVQGGCVQGPQMLWPRVLGAWSMQPAAERCSAAAAWQACLGSLLVAGCRVAASLTQPAVDRGGPAGEWARGGWVWARGVPAGAGRAQPAACCVEADDAGRELWRPRAAGALRSLRKEPAWSEAAVRRARLDHLPPACSGVAADLVLLGPDELVGERMPRVWDVLRAPPAACGAAAARRPDARVWAGRGLPKRALRTPLAAVPGSWCGRWSHGGAGPPCKCSESSQVKLGGRTSKCVYRECTVSVP